MSMLKTAKETLRFISHWKMNSKKLDFYCWTTELIRRFSTVQSRLQLTCVSQQLNVKWRTNIRLPMMTFNSLIFNKINFFFYNLIKHFIKILLLSKRSKMHWDRLRPVTPVGPVNFLSGESCKQSKACEYCNQDDCEPATSFTFNLN